MQSVCFDTSTRTMPSEQNAINCAHCGKTTLHARKVPNHLLHFFLSLITCLWVFVWALNSRPGPWRCQTCGIPNQEPVFRGGVDQRETNWFFFIVAALFIVAVAVYIFRALQPETTP